MSHSVQNSVKSRPTISSAGFSRAGCFSKCLHWNVGMILHSWNVYVMPLHKTLLVKWTSCKRLVCGRNQAISHADLHCAVQHRSQASAVVGHGRATTSKRPWHTCHHSHSALLADDTGLGWGAGQAACGLQSCCCVLLARGPSLCVLWSPSGGGTSCFCY